MPQFESLRYTRHAEIRMKERKLSRLDVEMALQSGECWIDEDGLWVCELGHVRIIVRDEQEFGVIITAMKLRGGER